MATRIVKRTGRIEPYAETKLHESVRHAALSVRALEGEAAVLAERTAVAVGKWVSDKTEVTSRDIHALAAAILYDLHAEAAYAYDVHDSTL